MNYSGIDLHSNNSVVSVIDETDRVVAEKRLPERAGQDPDVPCPVASRTGWRRCRIDV
ncbi:hypothetical protein VSR34_22740 [Paraburkholderia sp. JHI2823]|uniref:hypothetical protein n=1 Tax=Paraburkholderia TaxID=1822464 RepID=UPI000427DCFE|nr:hypothetical protein [Paraburkholderia mimosarum]